MIFDCR